MHREGGNWQNATYIYGFQLASITYNYIFVLRVMKPCDLEDGNRCFGTTFYFCLQATNMAVLYSPETLLPACQNTRGHNLEKCSTGPHR
jgi:hypothetical protein